MALTLIVYLFYSAFLLKNIRALIALVTPILGGIIGLLYRAWIKPMRKGLGFKIGSFVLTLIVAGFLGTFLGFINLNILDSTQRMTSPKEFPVLMADAFIDEEIDEWGTLERNTSILIPRSYEYVSHDEEDLIETEYAKALTEGLAENLVERYFQQANNRFRGRFGQEINQAFSEGKYHQGLESSGFTEEDFDQMYESGEAIEMGKIWDRMEEQSIVDASGLWNIEEAYFLNYDKTEIILREGREVYYLSGLDFQILRL